MRASASKRSGHEIARAMGALSWHSLTGTERDLWGHVEGWHGCALHASSRARRADREGWTDALAVAVGRLAGRMYWHADQIESAR